jgi:preprotein translocase subunit YajC
VFLQQPAPQPSPLGPLIMFLPIIAIFYLIVFRPARQRQKKLQQMVDNLKTGDKIITTGGLMGTVVGLRGDRLQVRIAENVKVEIARSAVAAMQQESQHE